MDISTVTLNPNNVLDVLKAMREMLIAQNNGAVQGRIKKVRTAKGTKLETQYTIVEAEKVVQSHLLNGKVNPEYPQELQPRDRSRQTSIAWVEKTAKDLDPEMLGVSGRADTGSPIVGKDMIVESGNGRVMAIKRAYELGKADEYKEWLIEEAEYLGIKDINRIKNMKQPILVRIRLTNTDRKQFTIEANQDDKLSYTATERAKTDAVRLDDNLIALFSPSEDGNFMAASNHKFLAGFLDKIGQTEAAQYVDSNGRFTQSFVTRVKQALFSKAYNDDRLLEMMADHSKPELQNVINALAISAPHFIQAQSISKAVKGQVEDLSSQIVDSIETSLDSEVAKAISQAMDLIVDARNKNQDLMERLKQDSLFEEMPKGIAEIAVFIHQNVRSAKKLAFFFNAMADYIHKNEVDSLNFNMFGEPEPLDLQTIVAYAQQQFDQEYNNANLGMFDSIEDTKQRMRQAIANGENPLQILVIAMELSKQIKQKQLEKKQHKANKKRDDESRLPNPEWLDVNTIKPLVIDDDMTDGAVRKRLTAYLQQFNGRKFLTVDNKVVRFNSDKLGHIPNDVIRDKSIIPQAVGHFFEVLQSGKFIGVQKETKGRAKYRGFHVYRKWVQVGDNNVHIQVKVAELTEDMLVANALHLIVYTIKDYELDKEKEDSREYFDDIEACQRWISCVRWNTQPHLVSHHPIRPVGNDDISTMFDDMQAFSSNPVDDAPLIIEILEVKPL